MKIEEAKKLLMPVCASPRLIDANRRVQRFSSPVSLPNEMMATDGRICAVVAIDDGSAADELAATFPVGQIRDFAYGGEVVASGIIENGALDECRNRFEGKRQAWLIGRLKERRDAIEGVIKCPCCGKFLVVFDDDTYEYDEVPLIDKRDYNDHNTEITYSSNVGCRTLLVNTRYLLTALDVATANIDKEALFEIVSYPMYEGCILRVSTPGRIAVVMARRTGFCERKEESDGTLWLNTEGEKNEGV